MAQRVKNPPSMQETQEMQVQSLGWEDLLEKGMATCCSILAWKTPWPEEPGRQQSTESQGVRNNCATFTFTECYKKEALCSKIGNVFPRCKTL